MDTMDKVFYMKYVRNQTKTFILECQESIKYLAKKKQKKHPLSVSLSGYAFRSAICIELKLGMEVGNGPMRKKERFVLAESQGQYKKASLKKLISIGVLRSYSAGTGYQTKDSLAQSEGSTATLPASLLK